MMDGIFFCGLSQVVQRQSDFLKEAADARLAKLATAHQSTLTTRLLSRIGDILISSGVGLKERCKRDMAYMYVEMQALQAGRRLEL
jgi:hypothetical protein